MIRMFCRVIAGIGIFCATAGAAEIKFTVSLPTPLEHYTTYNVQTAKLQLMMKITSGLDPEEQQKVAAVMKSGAGAAGLAGIQPEQIVKIIQATGLLKYKPEVLEIFLHDSQVLDIIPEKYRDSIQPIVHDGLLAFLDGLPLERVVESMQAMARDKNASRGQKILILASKTPTLQKIGQIISRIDAIPPDIQESLQTLEMGIRTMTRDELVAYITGEVGADRVKKYDFQFAGSILAEASVGAVILGSFADSPGIPRQEFVCKIIKPYVLVNLPRELDVLDALIDLAGKHGDFYHIEGFDIRDFFLSIKEQLSREIQIKIEQQHFQRAYDFYRDDKRVKVPQIYPFSSDHLTFMEFLPTQKLTDSFPGDAAKRDILAGRLATVMTFEAMFSRPPVSIFHGDPHGGNIMRLTDDPKDPCRLAMLDWGLMGEFGRQQRMQLVHLYLAAKKKSKKQIMTNIGSLISGGLPKDPGKLQLIDRLVSAALQKKQGVFELCADLLGQLLANGFPLDGQMSLFIKSQVTIAGILATLDPQLNQDKVVEKKVKGLVMKELPKRLLLLPAWNYRGYRSMLSNGDVFSYVF